MDGRAEKPSERPRASQISQFMSDERKTPEMRATMTDLERLRHSASHVLATAILKIWPEAQFAAGPPVENGFYYDVDLPHRISPDDFEKIEAEMKKEIKANHPFERVEVSRDEALELGKKGRLAALGERPEPSKFKLDIIENIPADEKISLYRSGDFIDLCAGPHVKRTGDIGAFRLTSVASAYYKGDEKNPQLQRIYGTAFKTKKELDDYFAMLEEAKKRDHRKLGKELELFVFDDDVGPGLPMFLPRGAVIAEELEKLAKETEFAAGYQRVRTPHIARESLYKKSGHLPYYAESMFPPMELTEDVEAIKRDPLKRESSETASSLATLQLFNEVLPQSDELSASPQVVCGAASQLSRSAVAAGGVRDGLSVREERRVVRAHAGALAADERRSHLLHAGAVRSGVQRRERDVSEIFQALRDRQIPDAFLDARSVEARPEICR